MAKCYNKVLHSRKSNNCTTTNNRKMHSSLSSSSLERLMDDTNSDKRLTDTLEFNPWITGGKFGSKDTVLVFRMGLLNKCISVGEEDDIDYDDDDDDDDEDVDSDDDADADEDEDGGHGDYANELDNGDNDDESDNMKKNIQKLGKNKRQSMDDRNIKYNGSMKLSFSSSSLKQISHCNNNHKKPLNNINKKMQTKSINKVLDALPKNVINKSNGYEKDDNPRKRLPKIIEKGMKMCAHESFSSSENSISSACDDPTEIENDILSASKKYNNTKVLTPTTVATASASTSQQQQSKSSIRKMDHHQHHHHNTILTSSKMDVGKENFTSEKRQKQLQINKSNMPGKQLKITYKFTNTETKILRKILSTHGLSEVSENEAFNLLWTGIHIKPDILRNLTPYQRVNHFPRSYELTRKDRLYKNIEKMQHLRGFKHFDIVPLSFMLPIQYRELQSAHRSGQRGPWIVKPAASSRGRGIFIVNSPEQISLDEQVIVSKYIANPLCIDGHKCDVRLYVAVTSFDPLLIYMYEEGLVRLATVKYERNSENLWNPCMHLCNYSINKYHSDYIKATESFEDVGHKWTFSALLRHLKMQGCDTKELMANIEDVIIKSIFACAQSIVSACRMFVPNNSNCFELYGFDILIDDTLKPWLLESNLSPSLGIDTPLDAKVKASLLCDLLTLTGIPAVTQLTRASYDNKCNRFRNTNINGSNSLNTRKSKATIDQSTTAGNGIGPKKHSMATNSSSSNYLSTDELKILRMVRAQYARRGGFIRIYPSTDSLQKYGQFLDTTTGIPLSTMSSSGTIPCPMIIPHNYNHMLHLQLFSANNSSQSNSNDGSNNGDASAPSSKSNQTDANNDNSLDSRMERYERPLLVTNQPLKLNNKKSTRKCSDEAKRLRKQIRKLIENGNELSQSQARKAFSLYLQCILKRFTHDPPKGQHEKLILKFITRSSGMNIKPPSFMKSQSIISSISSANCTTILSKDRSAIVAKLLGDYLQLYNRDTDQFEENFDRYTMIPVHTFNDFLKQAQEADLESILTLHTNLTQQMPFLYNRCALGIPPTPPIPTGLNGFLKALPSMAPNIGVKDTAKIDSYYKSISGSTSTTHNGSNSVAINDEANDKKCDNKINDKSLLKKRTI